MNNFGGIPLLCLRDKLLERRSTLSVAPLHQKDQNRKNHADYFFYDYVQIQLVRLTFNTRRLHANAVHGLIAESGPPLSVHIHVHARSVSAWFIFTPAGKLQMPTVDVFKITTSLQQDR